MDDIPKELRNLNDILTVNVAIIFAYRVLSSYNNSHLYWLETCSPVCHKKLLKIIQLLIVNRIREIQRNVINTIYYNNCMYKTNLHIIRLGFLM